MIVILAGIFQYSSVRKRETTEERREKIEEVERWIEGRVEYINF